MCKKLQEDSLIRGVAEKNEGNVNKGYVLCVFLVRFEGISSSFIKVLRMIGFRPNKWKKYFQFVT